MAIEAPVKPSAQLPVQYSHLKTSGTRMMTTLHESCTWGGTPDGGMSMQQVYDIQAVTD